MLVVDGHTLVAVHGLHLLGQVTLGGFHAFDAEYVARVLDAVGQLLTCVHGVAGPYQTLVSGVDRVVPHLDFRRVDL